MIKRVRPAAGPPTVEEGRKALDVVGARSGEIFEFARIGLEVEEARRLSGVAGTLLRAAGLESTRDDQLKVAGDEPAVAQTGGGAAEFEDIVRRVLAGDERARSQGRIVKQVESIAVGRDWGAGKLE